MYIMMLSLFAFILILSAAGMIMHGFNIIYLFILLFSAVVIIWSVAAMHEDKREGGDGNG